MILKKDTGGYLTAESVKTGEFLKILEEGEEVEKEYQGKKKTVFQVNVELPDKTEKIASFNATSRNNIIEFYGEDTKAWVGKEIRAEIVSQLVGKERKKVLYFTDPVHDFDGNLLP